MSASSVHHMRANPVLLPTGGKRRATLSAVLARGRTQR